MIFTPFKLHAIFGLVLIVIGFIFDFGLITTMENFSASLQKPVTQAWTKHVYDSIKFYLFVLGFLNIAFAMLVLLSGATEQSRWIIFGMMALGALFFITGGMWESQGPPAYEWTPACTVLTIGLAGVLLGIVLEAYEIIKWSG